jgi:hypothetical protein
MISQGGTTIYVLSSIFACFGAEKSQDISFGQPRESVQHQEGKYDEVRQEFNHHDN